MFDIYLATFLAGAILAAFSEILVRHDLFSLSKISCQRLKHISKDLRECALWLLEHDYIPSDVGEIFAVSERSLRRWKVN